MLFTKKVSYKNSNMFIDPIKFRIITVEKFIDYVFKQLVALNKNDTKDAEKFNNAIAYFYSIWKVLPIYDNGDFFSDDEYDLLFDLYEILGSIHRSSENGGGFMWLSNVMEERGIFKNMDHKNKFLQFLKAHYPWQFGIHNWKPYNQEVLKDIK